MSSYHLYPVQILREHLTGLQVAIATCLADPDHKPVHKLRTETRRTEAVILLLALIPQVPEHRAEAARMLRALRKLRRAAGRVRDLDVHRKLLEAITETELASVEGSSLAPKPVQAGDEAAVRPESHGTEEAQAEPSKARVLSGAATELRETLSHQRETSALRLQDVLVNRQAKTAKRAEALLRALQAADAFELPGPELLRDAEAVMTRHGLLGRSAVSELDAEELHTVRKAAKKARYLAETLPQDATLASAAQRFEALQEAGGQWHDALQLAHAARRHFGKGHTLTVTYTEDRDRKLEQYRAALQADVEAKKAKKAPLSQRLRTAGRSRSRVTTRAKRKSDA